MEKATFGAGCFWGVEAAFAAIPGVTATAAGYEGGSLQSPTYKDVCTDQTAHAEVVEVDFDPAQVKFEQLLDAFFSLHDPTTLNRQGADEGAQYRSIILCHGEAQKLAAEKSKAGAQKNFKHPIVTEIVPFTKFYKAADDHQEYYDNNSSAPCCQIVIAPKLKKLEKEKVIEARPQR